MCGVGNIHRLKLYRITFKKMHPNILD